MLLWRLPRGWGGWEPEPSAGWGRRAATGEQRAARDPEPLSLFPSRVPPPTPPTPHTPCLPVSLGNLQLKASHPHGNMYPSNKKKKVWREEKERLLKMTLEERRKEYLRDYVPLNTIPSWKEEMKGKSQNDVYFESRKTRWGLLWEESVLKKETETLFERSQTLKKDARNMYFIMYVTCRDLPRMIVENWERRKLRNVWILWVLVENCWSSKVEKKLMLQF